MMITRYEFIVKKIDNGWLFTTEADGEILTHYFKEEISALKAAQEGAKIAIDLLKN